MHELKLFKSSSDAKTKKKRGRGGMKIEEEGGSFYFHPFNNGGMISAYPLNTSLLFSSPSLLSIAPLFFSSGERKASLFLSPAYCFFCHPSICLSLQFSLHLSLLSKEGILLYGADLVPFFPLFHSPLSLSISHSSQTYLEREVGLILFVTYTNRSSG